jgi:hypothetical protein
METLRLLRDGRWLHDGGEVKHARLAALLHRSIARDEDGALIVTTGRDRLPFECEDAPFRVITVRRRGHAWTLVLSDGGEESLVADEELLIDDDGAVRSRVKGGRFWALWSRSAAQAVASVVDEELRVRVEGGHAQLVQIQEGRAWTR